MGKEFDFKSQICTDRFQSERLLALGLKPETVDCTLIPSCDNDGTYVQKIGTLYLELRDDAISAWSLDRLRELLPKKIQYGGPLCYREYQLVITDDSVFYVSFEHNDWLLGYGQSLWESMLISIEWLINEELFNKEYLEE